jgi:hypothetical protein
MNQPLLVERDAMIFSARRAGKSTAQIAKQMKMSERAVQNSIQRTLAKMNRETLLAAPEVLRMELERLDALQQAIWPFTQPRRVVLPDGTETVVDPDLKAVQQILQISDRRIRLMGLDTLGSQALEPPEPAVRAALAGAERAAGIAEFDPKTESMRMLELMGSSGILDEATVNALMGRDGPQPVQAPEPARLRVPDVIDAEVVE